MTSDTHDRMATTGEPTWLRPLLGDVSRLVAQLAASGEVGADVAEDVRRLGSRIPLDDPAGGFEGTDPHLGEALLAGFATSLLAVAEAGDGRRDRLLVALERMRQALRDAVEEGPTQVSADPRQVARWLSDAVPVPQASWAELVGVTPRTFQRWSSRTDRTRPTAEEAGRLTWIAGAVTQLRHSLTPSGVVAWFHRPNPALEGKAPVDLLDDPDRARQIVVAARRMRSQVSA